jgi:hypothetical protein
MIFIYHKYLITLFSSNKKNIQSTFYIVTHLEQSILGDYKKM